MNNVLRCGTRSISRIIDYITTSGVHYFIIIQRPVVNCSLQKAWLEKTWNIAQNSYQLILGYLVIFGAWQLKLSTIFIDRKENSFCVLKENKKSYSFWVTQTWADEWILFVGNFSLNMSFWTDICVVIFYDHRCYWWNSTALSSRLWSICAWHEKCPEAKPVENHYLKYNFTE